MTESSETPGVLITDGNNRVLLHPPVPYPDGHGFRQQVDVQAGPFSGTVQVSSFESKGVLRAYYEQLQALYRDLKGKVSLPNSYEELEIDMTGDGRGHVAVKVNLMVDNVDIRTGFPLKNRLEFGFCIDQTQLPDITASMEPWLRSDGN